MSDHFRPKSPEELDTQVLRTAEALGQDIAQPSSRPDVMDLSADELKKKYPRRYEMYLTYLRSERTDASVADEEKEEMAKWLKTLNSLDDYIESHKLNTDDRTLRERQLTVFEDLRDFLEQGGNKGYIKLPTGVGKTVLFTEFLEATNLKSIIIVPKNPLVRQTGEKLEKFASGLEFGKVNMANKDFGKQVTITTYQSLIRQVENGGIKPSEYDCLILDEAHRALGQKTSTILEQFPRAISIGFTATPDFSEQKKLRDLLPEVIHSMTINEAIELGLLCPGRPVFATTNIDISNVRITKNGQHADYQSGEIEKAVNVQARNQAALELYQTRYAGRSAIANCAGVAHARAIAELLRENGTSAVAVTQETPEKERAKIFEDFANGNILVLCNVDVLTEGFDEPRASLALNLRPTLSPVVEEQRDGRVLRVDQNNPDKIADVVNFFDRDSRSAQRQITFYDILGGTVELPKLSSESEGGGGGGAVRDRVKVEELEVITDVRTLDAVLKKIDRERKGLAEEGWLPLSEAQAQMSAYIEGEMTDTFKNFLIEKERKSEPDARSWAGWQALRLQRILKESVKELRTARPADMRKFKDASGKVVDHVSPEFARTIKEQLDAYLPAPNLYLTDRQLAEEILNRLGTRSVSESLKPFVRYNRFSRNYEPGNELNAMIREMSKDHPEWIINRRVYTGGSYVLSKYPYRHFAPVLLDQIRQELATKIQPPKEKVEKPIDIIPEGWQPLSSVASEWAQYWSEARPRLLGNFLDNSKVAQGRKFRVAHGLEAIDESRRTFERVFKDNDHESRLLNRGGEKRERFVSPAFIAIMEKSKSEFLPAPDGYIDLSEIESRASKLLRSRRPFMGQIPELAAGIVREAASQHPSLVVRRLGYAVRNGEIDLNTTPVLYAAPEFVTALEHLIDEKFPKDWQYLGKRKWLCPNGHEAMVPRGESLAYCDRCHQRKQLETSEAGHWPLAEGLSR